MRRPVCSVAGAGGGGGAPRQNPRAHFSNCPQAALAGWFDTDWRWLTDPQKAGGGALLDSGAHVLDIALLALSPPEGDVTGVACALGNRVGRDGNGRSVVD